jgi:hypothetical protein
LNHIFFNWGKKRLGYVNFMVFHLVEKGFSM